MPRVIGIDPGTVSVDVCGLDDGHVFLDRSLPTVEALAHPSVPAHRKVNRVDMGTADKVCAVALAVREHAERCGCSERDVSLILLEMGGAFTAAIAVQDGGIVDGAGGTSGPLGVRAAGALDGRARVLG